MPQHPPTDADADDLDALVAAMAPVLGISVEEEWRPAVVANLATLAGAAQLVAAFALDDEVELAPVFRA